MSRTDPTSLPAMNGSSNLMTAFSRGIPNLTPEDIDKFVNNHVQRYSTSFRYNSVDFEEGLNWFNTTCPLTLSKDLRGKIVVLEFFTSSCINCQHVFPELLELSRIYSVENGVAVVGVHSPKFDHERNSSAVQYAVMKYDLQFPVVNDPDGKVAQAFQVKFWPTAIILGPEGQILFTFVGAGHREHALLGVKTCLDYFNYRNRISYHSLPLRTERDFLPSNVLLYPSKICTSPDGILLAISDTGHHRIVVTCCLGLIKWEIGTGEKGFCDGAWDVATFASPQGVCWGHNAIYVADSENHAIRKVDLVSKTVRTIAGNGSISADDEGGSRGVCQMLNTPWDVCLANSASAIPEDPDCLLIAMMGFNQIWLLTLRDGVRWYKQEDRVLREGFCARICGSGAEDNSHSISPFEAGFSQPSGLAFDPELKRVFVADSKSSAVRAISLVDGSVGSVVGGSHDPSDMYTYSDRDGTACEVKLQYPLGIAYSRRFRKVLVADTFNHKIKVLDPVSRICQTLIGTGQAGDWVGPTSGLNEPGGVCVNETENHCLLYMTDTNNCCIKAVDMNTGVSIKIPMTYRPESRVVRPIKGWKPYAGWPYNEDISGRQFPKGCPIVQAITHVDFKTSTVVNFSRVIVGLDQTITLNVEISGLGLEETEEIPTWSLWMCDERVISNMDMTDFLGLPVSAMSGLLSCPQEQGFLHLTVKSSLPREVLGFFMIMSITVVFMDKKRGIRVPKLIRFMLPCRLATAATVSKVTHALDLRYLIGV